MDFRQHALLARRLIEDCGGPEKIIQLGICRFKGSTWLYKFMEVNAATPSFMPADVIADLEAYCGKPLYSQPLFEARPGTHDAHSAWEEACEATESSAELQRICRLAHVHPGGATPRMRAAIEKAALRLMEEGRQVLEANERGDI